MADISDDEVIEKPKRVMSDKQKEALKKGRELAKMNREAQKPKAEPKAEVEPKVEDIKELKKRVKKVEVKEEIKNEVVAPPKRISRKQTPPTRESSPETVSEEEVAPVKKTRTPRKKQIAEEPVQHVPAKQVRVKPALQFV